MYGARSTRRTEHRVAALPNGNLESRRGRKIGGDRGRSYRRHYPGKIELLTNAQLAERVRFYRRGLTDVVFHSSLEVAAGPYVTTAWETLGTTRKGQRLCTAGIEIFKIEEGLITDVCNGHPQDGQFAWNLKWDRPVRDADFLDVQERVKNWGIQTTAE